MVGPRRGKYKSHTAQCKRRRSRKDDSVCEDEVVSAVEAAARELFGQNMRRRHDYGTPTLDRVDVVARRTRGEHYHAHNINLTTSTSLHLINIEKQKNVRSRQIPLIIGDAMAGIITSSKQLDLASILSDSCHGEKQKRLCMVAGYNTS